MSGLHEWATRSSDGFRSQFFPPEMGSTWRDVYEFTVVEAGQPCVVGDGAGRIVLRDRGMLRHRVVFASLGDGNDPFRPRRRLRFEVTGAWSVRLFAGGFHSDHVHPRGWLSGVFYVDLPPEVEREGNRDARAGWLRLGKPGIRTQPELAADAFVKPERGVLVLFPAYVWHGVQPFDSPAARLSVAFDALPA